MVFMKGLALQITYSCCSRSINGKNASPADKKEGKAALYSMAMIETGWLGASEMQSLVPPGFYLCLRLLFAPTPIVGQATCRTVPMAPAMPVVQHRLFLSHGFGIAMRRGVFLYKKGVLRDSDSAFFRKHYP